MKTNWVVLAAAAVMTASTSFAGGGVNIGVYIGGPAPVYAVPAPVYVQPGPVYIQPQPVYVQPGPAYVGGRVYRGGPRYVAPRGRVWVPGYWAKPGRGHGKKWVAGYYRYR